MTYLQRSSEKRKDRKQKAVVLFIFAVVLLIGFVSRGVITNLFHKTLYPVNKTVETTTKPVIGFFDYFKSKKNLTERNDVLENENRSLKIDLLSIDSVRTENRELKGILGVKDSLDNPRVTSEVILTPPFSPFDTFVIRIFNNYEDGGADFSQKISIGDSVFIKNILVGKITEVYDVTAVAKLYSSFEQNLPVRINRETIAEAEGLGGLSFKIELPKDLEIEEGLPIFSMEYPDSIIGFINNIEKIENSSFQTIYFQYPFTFSEFNYVEVEY
jgi:cell shape-determining protein MreC